MSFACKKEGGILDGLLHGGGVVAILMMESTCVCVCQASGGVASEAMRSSRIQEKRTMWRIGHGHQETKQ